MRVTVKLFASLARFLPPGAKDNEVPLDLPEGATPATVLDRLQVPRSHCHLTLVNGAYVPPSRHDAVALRDGDTVAAWPPIAGG